MNLNPQIENPHRIYPGERIRVSSGLPWRDENVEGYEYPYHRRWGHEFAERYEHPHHQQRGHEFAQRYESPYQQQPVQGLAGGHGSPNR